VIRTAVVITVLLFLVTLVVRLPAALVAGLLPAPLHCEDASGTLWSGACGQLRSGTFSVSDLTWTLHPSALLRLSIAADVESADPALRGHAAIDYSRGGLLSMTQLNASAALQRGALLGLPVTGVVVLALPQASVLEGHVRSLQGSITLQQLHIANPPTDLGDFELQFAPQGAGDPMIGQLRDVNSPLSVAGQLRLLPSGAYELSGTLAAHDPQDAHLNQVLQLLGPADAQGRHAFSLAGTL